MWLGRSLFERLRFQCNLDVLSYDLATNNDIRNPGRASELQYILDLLTDLEFRGQTPHNRHAPDTKLMALLGSACRAVLASSLVISIIWHSETPVIDFALDIRLQDVHKYRRDAQPERAVIDRLAHVVGHAA